MLENTLKKVGLSRKDIQVYLACLRLGPSPVRKIAEVAEVNRGTAYDILRSLIYLGLVTYYHKDKHQYFIAEDPDKLKDVISQQEDHLKKTRSEIGEIIPQLKSIYDKAGTKPVVKYYEGYGGIKVVLKDVIDTCAKNEKNYYAYSSSAIKEYLYDAYPHFSDDRIEAKIKVKTISIGAGGDTRGLDERKWLTKKESAPTYTLIYEDKVAMISVDKNDKPIGIIVEDPNLYQTQKMIFESMWKTL